MRKLLFAVFLALAASDGAAAEGTSGVTAALTQSCAADAFSGSVLMVRDGRAVLRLNCGLADREAGAAMTSDTPLRIASVGKVFTAVAVLQLVEAGKVDLDAPLIRYLPDYPNKELASKVTIRHLLSHTGGTGDIFGPDFSAHADDLKTTADYIQLYGPRPLAFEPGSKRSYSNYGFVLLGRVIEAVSGEDYFAYVQKNVFERAGMTNASFPVNRPEPSRLSSAYSGPAGQRTKVTLMMYRGTPCGGGMASAADLVRFGEALLDGRLISQAMLAHVAAGDLMVGGAGYAYGFDRAIDDKGRVFLSHGGNGSGINASLRIYPQSHTVVAVIANFDQPAAYDAMKIAVSALD